MSFNLFFLDIPDAFQFNGLGVDQPVKLSLDFLQLIVGGVDPLLELGEFSFNFGHRDVDALVD